MIRASLGSISTPLPSGRVASSLDRINAIEGPVFEGQLHEVTLHHVVRMRRIMGRQEKVYECSCLNALLHVIQYWEGVALPVALQQNGYTSSSNVLQSELFEI